MWWMLFIIFVVLIILFKKMIVNKNKSAINMAFSLLNFLNMLKSYFIEFIKVLNSRDEGPQEPLWLSVSET